MRRPKITITEIAIHALNILIGIAFHVVGQLFGLIQYRLRPVPDSDRGL